jgi:hypothetical protein
MRAERVGRARGLTPYGRTAALVPPAKTNGLLGMSSGRGGVPIRIYFKGPSPQT